MKVGIIGLGLIGGSLGLDLQANGFAWSVSGWDQDEQHRQQALELGLVNELAELEEMKQNCELIILAIPVGAIVKVLPQVLDGASKGLTVTDMGSTKNSIAEAVEKHPQRALYVASHPMAGTEFSGPAAAIPQLYVGKVAIICDREKSAEKGVHLVERMYRSLYMRVRHMKANEHDLHAAYVSHISHISSFVLANTVLNKEKSERAIFDLASGGFESTARLAKSSPEMWAPIFDQNKKALLEVIDIYSEQMQLVRNYIEKGDINAMKNWMKKANEIKRILN